MRDDVAHGVHLVIVAAVGERRRSRRTAFLDLASSSASALGFRLNQVHQMMTAASMVAAKLAAKAFSAQVASYPCGGEVVGAFLRGEAAKGVGDGLPEVGDGSRSGGAKRSFELGEGHFDGIEVGAIWRQVSQARPGGLDRLSDAMNLVRGQIVHDHDVARPQLGSERLFDIGEKGLTVHRAVEDHGSSDAVGTQPGGEGGGFPMAMGHGGAASLALGARP